MLRSTWQRRNESLVVALGHEMIEGGLRCDVVLVAADTPVHDLELEDAEGTLFAVNARPEWFGKPEAARYFNVGLAFSE